MRQGLKESLKLLPQLNFYIEAQSSIQGMNMAVDTYSTIYIKRIFYSDLTILSCSNPQIRQIIYQLLLNTLI